MLVLHMWLLLTMDRMTNYAHHVFFEAVDAQGRSLLRVQLVRASLRAAPVCIY